MEGSGTTSKGFAPTAGEEGGLGTEAADLAELGLFNDVAGTPAGEPLSSKDDPGSAAAIAASFEQSIAEGIAEPVAADALQNAGGGRVLTSDEQLLALSQRARSLRGGKGPGQETGRAATYRAKTTKYAKKVGEGGSHSSPMLLTFR